MDSTNSSIFGSALGMAAGWAIAGPFGALIGGGMLGSIFGSSAAAKEEKEAQKRMLKLQQEQNQLLMDNKRADMEELHSSIQSAVSQQAGAMGAIY